DDDVAVARAGADLDGPVVLLGAGGTDQLVADHAVLGRGVDPGGRALGHPDLDGAVGVLELDLAADGLLDADAGVRGPQRRLAGRAVDRDRAVRAVHAQGPGRLADLGVA